MRTLDAASLAYLGGRTDIIARHLVWFQARRFNSGAIETAGLWTGDDATTFTVGSENRVYQGAGSVLGIDPMRSGVGLEVRMLSLTLSDLTPEVAQLVRGYDVRLAPVELHRVLLDLASRTLIAPPMPVFLGWVDESSIVDGGDTSEVRLNLASDARRLTRPAPLYRSDAAMRQRNPTDRFRENTDIGRNIPVWWGREREEV